MKISKYFILKALIVLLWQVNIYSQEKSSLCFTFDDGTAKNILDYDYLAWNQMILDNLKNNNLQAILFLCGSRLNNSEGKQIIDSWDKSGHLIANHTYNHLNYNNPEVSYEIYRTDIIKCDSLINGYENYTKLFRAPFLKNGKTVEKRDSLISFLKQIEYKNGYVTIDASDWYFNSKLIKFINNNPDSNIDKYREVYIEHLIDRAKYYDNLAFELLGRKIKHSILLHHNLISALFLGDLIKAFKEEGWEIINAADALEDQVYQMDINTLPAGESIIWSLAKEAGNYDDLLRYPAEDSKYEEEKLEKLGL